MRRASSPSTSITSGRHHGKARAGGSPSAALSELQGRFAAFRQAHPTGTRIPKDLRQAALAALQRGVPPGLLYRTCGVGWGQLAAWKRAQAQAATLATPRAVVPSDVRILSVVDEPPKRPAPSHDLELRLGPWAISVRLLGSEQG